MTIDFLNLDISNLPDDLLVLTPNRRLAAWLGRDYDQLQQQQGKKTWRRLNVQPLDVWWRQMFDELCLLIPPPAQGHPRLLSPAQNTLLWRQVLEQLWDQSQDIEGLATLAQQARALTLRWCWQPSQWSVADTLEQQQFSRWHDAYCVLLNEQNCLDSAALSGWVVNNGAAILDALPRHIWLHGFNDPDEPQLQKCIRWLEEYGKSTVRFTELPSRAGITQLVTTTQVDEQFAQALQWAVQQHRAGYSRVGVVIPNLQPRRAQIRALCKQVWSLQPESPDVHWSAVINITAAQTLNEYPLVAQLLLWLRGLASELSLEEWRVLLTSPYSCAEDAEWLRRDGFFVWLQEQNLRSLTLPALQS